MADKDKTFMIEGAQIVFRNFSGEARQYNAAGERNFCVILGDDAAETLSADGWNVKILEPKEEGDPARPFIKVKVGYKYRPPRIVLRTSSKRGTDLSEDMLSVLDHASFDNVDFIARAVPWETASGSGITAYLKTMFVTLEEDELERKYAVNESVGD